MTVTLNIQQDDELRAYIKDMIKGQVLAIVREELTADIKKELSRHLEKHGSTNIEFLMRKSFEAAAKVILMEKFEVYRWQPDFINPIVTSLVIKAMENISWQRLVDNAASEKLKSLIK